MQKKSVINPLSTNPTKWSNTRKGVLKICGKLAGEHACRSVISVKLLCSFIEIALRHGYTTVNLLHIFRTPFPKNTSGRLLLKINLSDSLVRLQNSEFSD